MRWWAAGTIACAAICSRALLQERGESGSGNGLAAPDGADCCSPAFAASRLRTVALWRSLTVGLGGLALTVAPPTGGISTAARRRRKPQTARPTCASRGAGLQEGIEEAPLWSGSGTTGCRAAAAALWSACREASPWSAPNPISMDFAARNPVAAPGRRTSQVRERLRLGGASLTEGHLSVS